MPFSVDQFFHVFEKYNQAIFPGQWILLALGIAAMILLHSRSEIRDKLIGCFLGLLWIWTGIAYHIAFFSQINKPAFVFGGIFIVQGLLILYNVFGRGRLGFAFISNTRGYVGYFLILFGLIIYPVIGYLVNGLPARTISLGLPCPSVIYTFGIFILANKKFPKYLLIIPTLWSVVGLSAAINFGVYQDFMLIISAIIVSLPISRKA
jgi:hypothetical protein